MITDPDQIQAAISQVISDDSYIHLQAKDFADICPNPTWGIHVHMRNIDALMMIVKIYLEILLAGGKELRGIIVYIRGSSLTMEGLSRIDGIIPSAQRFKRGLGFKDDGGDNEIWIFAEALQ